MWLIRLAAFSQSDIRAIISAPYLFGVVTFVLFAVATPNKYGDLLFESRMTSRRLRELSWRNRLDFAFALLRTGSFAPIEKWSTRPHGLFTLPAALHALERTCYFKHCSYVIFTSYTDGIRGVSIVKNIAVICHYHFRRTFRCDFVNTDTCVHKKIRQHIIVYLWYGHMVFYRDIQVDTRNYTLKNRFYLKDVANGTRIFLIRMLCVFIII